MKTSELDGPALNWAVQEALLKTLPQPALGILIHRVGYGHKVAAYSTDWAQGGPIIEQERICVEFDHHENGEAWSAAYDNETGPWRFGTTPLIAAMRCFCCAKLGDEIEIPKELI